MFKNNVKTAALLAPFLGAIFLGVGSLFGTGPADRASASVLVFVGGSYWKCDVIAVRPGRQAGHRAEAPQRCAIVRELTQRAGIPMPACTSAPRSSPTRSPPAATLSTQRSP